MIVDDIPAFPTEIVTSAKGLTKREYLAGQALQGFFSGVPFPLADQPLDPGEELALSEAARLCVAAADALIEELGK